VGWITLFVLYNFLFCFFLEYFPFVGLTVAVIFYRFFFAFSPDLIYAGLATQEVA